jgi:anti-sigma regulatory factor (Ser/Thr protein kinase)
LERLARVVPGDTAEESCATVISALLGHVDPGDDAAVLVVRTNPVGADAPLQVELPAKPSSLALLRGALRRWLSTAGADPDLEMRVLLAIGEAATNAVEHAYGPAGGPLEVEVWSHPDGVEARVRDHGSWREARGQGRGRGLSIIEQCADRVEVGRGPDGTSVRLRFEVRSEGVA